MWGEMAGETRSSYILSYACHAADATDRPGRWPASGLLVGTHAVPLGDDGYVVGVDAEVALARLRN